MKFPYRRFIEDNFLIINKPPEEKAVPFVFNRVQRKYYSILKKKYPKMDGIREIILKARQEGFSSLILALFTVDFIAYPNSTSVCISHKTDATEKLFRRVRFYIRSYCEKNNIDIKDYLKTDNKAELENKTNGAYFYLGTAGAKVGGRGQTVRNLHLSESAYYQTTGKFQAKEIIEGSAQQVPQGHGSIFIESCVVGDTLIFSNRGLLRIKDVMPKCLGMSKGQPIMLATRYGKETTSFYYNSGERETIKVCTDKGYEIEGSRIHPILCLQEGKIVWKKLRDIRLGDYVAIQYGQDLWGNDDSLNFISMSRKGTTGNKQIYNPGKTLTEDLSYLCGLFLAEGYARKRKSGSYVVIASGDKPIHRMLPQITGFKWHMHRKEKQHSRATKKSFVEFLEYMGFDINQRAPQKEIPARFFRASRKNIAAFLSGLFDGDGSAHSNTGIVSYITSSEKLAKGLQILLLNFGIVSKLVKYSPPQAGFIGKRKIFRNKYYYMLSLNKHNSRLFYEKIGFRLKRKQKIYTKVKNIHNIGFIVPGIGNYLKGALQKSGFSFSRLANNGEASRKVFYTKGQGARQNTLRTYIHKAKIQDDNLIELSKSKYYWVKVVKINKGKDIVYDFHVPHGHSFITNGFVSHNTGKNYGDYFQKEYARAEKGLGIYKARFFGWQEFYSDEWIEQKKKEFQNEKDFFKEYPSCFTGDTLVSSKGKTFYFNERGELKKGINDVYRVETYMGYSVKATKNHLFMLSNGKWKRLKDMQKGDVVKLLPPDFSVNKKLFQVKIDYGLPILNTYIPINEELAELIGLFMGDGSIRRNKAVYNFSLVFDKKDQDVVDKYKKILTKYFKKPGQRLTGKTKNCVELRFGHRYLKEIALSLGMARLNNWKEFKRHIHVPCYIFASPPKVIAAFLRGLFDADGFIGRSYPSIRWFTAYDRFLWEVQILLLGLGITCRTTKVKKRAGDGHFYMGRELQLRYNETRMFMDKIGFVSRRKNGLWKRYREEKKKKTGHPRLPIVHEDKVVAIKRAGKEMVYDMEVLPERYYSANGFYVHNSADEAFLHSGEGFFSADSLLHVKRQVEESKIIKKGRLAMDGNWL